MSTVTKIRESASIVDLAEALVGELAALNPHRSGMENLASLWVGTTIEEKDFCKQSKKSQKAVLDATKAMAKMFQGASELAQRQKEFHLLNDEEVEAEHRRLVQALVDAEVKERLAQHALIESEATALRLGAGASGPETGQPEAVPAHAAPEAVH